MHSLVGSHSIAPLIAQLHPQSLIRPQYGTPRNVFESRLVNILFFKACHVVGGRVCFIPRVLPDVCLLPRPNVYTRCLAVPERCWGDRLVYRPLMVDMHKEGGNVVHVGTHEGSCRYLGAWSWERM